MITRENYEEYFLLYTDNELTAAERADVEQFIAAHPDLREEWEAFLQCRLTPEPHLIFPGRAGLLKPETEATSYTEALILYLDGELEPAAAARIEELIRQQPHIAKEFTALKQTVSQPDRTIVFAGKTALYRNERSRRIMLMPWVRVGVAAAIAGAIALVWMFPFRPAPTRPVASTKVGPAIAVPPAAVRTISHTPPAAPSTAQTSSSVGANQPPIAQTSNAHSRNLTAAVTSVAASPLHHRTGHWTKQTRPDLAANVANKLTPVPEPATGSTDPGLTVLRADPVGTAVISDAANEPAAGDLAVNVRPAATAGIPRDESSFATQALEEEATEERSNNLISEEMAAPERAGLRGIFRKVTRAFGKTADRDDDGKRQVLVGAFRISLN